MCPLSVWCIFKSRKAIVRSIYSSCVNFMFAVVSMVLRWSVSCWMCLHCVFTFSNISSTLYDVLHCELGAFFKASVQISYYFDGGLNWCFCDIKIDKKSPFVIDRATLTTNNFRLNSVNCTNQYKLACKNKTKKVQPDSSSALTKKNHYQSHTLHVAPALSTIPVFFNLSVHWMFIKQSYYLI